MEQAGEWQRYQTDEGGEDGAFSQGTEGWWVRVSNIPRGTLFHVFKDALMRMIQGEAEGHQPTKVLMCNGFESVELCFRDVEAAESAITAIRGGILTLQAVHIAHCDRMMVQAVKH
jgi:hypothetical protein